MNIIEARQQMMAGKRIKRPQWENMYWYYDNGCIQYKQKYYHQGTDSKSIIFGAVGSLNQHSIFANDYMIYEGEEYE